MGSSKAVDVPSTNQERIKAELMLITKFARAAPVHATSDPLP